jgi:hypothetical protein
MAAAGSFIDMIVISLCAKLATVLAPYLGIANGAP